MPLGSDLVGVDLGRLEVRCDPRWTMGFAAGIPDEAPQWFDTESGVAVHPVFPVCPEWEHIIGIRSSPRRCPPTKPDEAFTSPTT
jgi:hypothetical protein